MRFLHSGKLGDVVYALAGLKSCRRSTLYLNVRGPYGFCETQARQLTPLVDCQPYVERVAIWMGEDYDYSLDDFRFNGFAGENIADAHLRVLGLSRHWRQEAWLSVPELADLRSPKVIFARSQAHRGVNGFWDACYGAFKETATFVGTLAEHQEFCDVVGEIAYLPTQNLLELAQVISGSALFVGNQSCPFAIAEGLKIPCIQETYGVANCVFERANAFHVRESADLTRIGEFAEVFIAKEGVLS